MITVILSITKKCCIGKTCRSYSDKQSFLAAFWGCYSRVDVQASVSPLGQLCSMDFQDSLAVFCFNHLLKHIPYKLYIIYDTI